MGQVTLARAVIRTCLTPEELVVCRVGVDNDLSVRVDLVLYGCLVVLEFLVCGAARQVTILRKDLSASFKGVGFFFVKGTYGFHNEFALVEDDGFDGYNIK